MKATGPRPPSVVAGAAAMPAGETIAIRMEATGGRTSGFDYLRIILAAMVVLAHSRAATIGLQHHGFAMVPGGPVSSGALPHPPLGQPVVWAILPSFFALSGFLVAGSLTRSRTTVEFVLLRAIRLVPALFVETLLAAFILGPLVTELPLQDYLTHPLFLSYPLNIVGDIHYSLPGVFTHNPWPGVVNQQLWTIPGELFCYLTLVGVSVSGLARHRPAVLGAVLLAILGFSIATFAMPGVAFRWTTGASNAGLSTLWLSFLCGVSIYFWRDRIPLNLGLFALAVVLTYVLLYDGAFQYLATVPIAYATVYVGLTDFRKTIINKTGDYSYGVYLYGFPIQQLIAYLVPANRNWGLNFVLALLISLGLAALSWHLVESKALDQRKRVLAAVRSGQDWMAARLNAVLPPRLRMQEPGGPDRR